MTINFIQDIATPHNNIVLKELEKDENINLNVWYCHEKHPQYNWNIDLTNEIKEANIYNPNKIDWDFIQYCLKNKEEKYFIVGWMNPSTKFLILLFWILRRPFNIWFDYPQDNRSRRYLKQFFRELYYKVLVFSKANIFCVGKMTVEYFVNRGFKEEKLTNLPIFVNVQKNKDDYKYKKKDIFLKYNIQNNDLFLSAGSRLVYDKGYDILIEAISTLDDKIKQNIKCVIVGQGEEKNKLEHLIEEYKLTQNIYIEEWMEIEDFNALISCSDMFVHPARFDAYGATIFAMSLGIPAIGSVQAGAAYDRIEDMKNGILYDGSKEKLSVQIAYIFANKGLLDNMSVNALSTAREWDPIKALEIIRSNIK